MRHVMKATCYKSGYSIGRFRVYDLGFRAGLPV